MPWNLHEPEKGVFDFGDGGRELSPFLDLRRFLEMAKEEDLLVVFRPGTIHWQMMILTRMIYYLSFDYPK